MYFRAEWEVCKGSQCRHVVWQSSLDAPPSLCLSRIFPETETSKFLIHFKKWESGHLYMLTQPLLHMSVCLCECVCVCDRCRWVDSVPTGHTLSSGRTAVRHWLSLSIGTLMLWHTFFCTLTSNWENTLKMCSRSPCTVHRRFSVSAEFLLHVSPNQSVSWKRVWGGFASPHLLTPMLRACSLPSFGNWGKSTLDENKSLRWKLYHLE